MRWSILLILCLLWTVARADLGRLAYIAGGALWVKALPNGAAHVVAKGKIASPVWSASGAWLIYHDCTTDCEKLARFDGKEVLTPKEMTNTVWNAAWSPVDDTLAFTTEYGGLWLCDVANSATHMIIVASKLKSDPDVRSGIPPYADRYIGKIVWAHDGRTLALATQNGGLFLYDVASGRFTKKYSS